MSPRSGVAPLARGVMAARQVLALKIEVRVLAGEYSFMTCFASSACVTP